MRVQYVPIEESRADRSAQTLEQSEDTTQQFTIGKVDAGIAVLISDGVGPGSIVNISCTRNDQAEKRANQDFWSLQQAIMDEYGSQEPTAPSLRVRNVTQTSVTLEWDKLNLAKADLASLSIWRNGQRLTAIPNALSNTSTKLSGLALNTEYSFHLVMKTSAGTHNSNIVKVRTHTIEQTSGISVCFGYVRPRTLLDEARRSIEQMGAKMSDKIQIDTTHFVATAAASADHDDSAQGDAKQAAPGPEYLKAVQLSIPVVSPEWVIACAREKKMVGIANYYSVGTVNNVASISSTGTTAPLQQQAPPATPRKAADVTNTAQETATQVDSAGDESSAASTAAISAPEAEPSTVAETAAATQATTTEAPPQGPVATPDTVATNDDDGSAEKVMRTDDKQDETPAPAITVSEGEVADTEGTREDDDEGDEVQDLEEVSLQ